MGGCELKIKILGTGCDKCEKLEANVKEALSTLGIEASVDKVEDLIQIMKYGIMTTPGLVIDEKVVSYGKVLKPKDIAKILENYR